MDESTLRRIVTGVVLLICIAASFVAMMFVLNRPRETTGEVEIRKSIAVELRVLATTNMADRVTVPGRLEAWSDALLSLEQAGRIVELMTDAGDAIVKDQVLLRCDDRIQRQTVVRAEALLARREAEVVRFQPLREAGSVSQDRLDELVLARDLVLTELEQARVMLDQCEIRSPVNGVVVERFVELGEYLAVGTETFRVIDASRLKLVVDIPERDVFGVSDNTAMQFTVDALDGRTFKGRLHYLSPAGDHMSSTFRCEVAYDNSDGALRPGVLARLAYRRGEFRDVVAVPLSALIPEKGQYVAYVCEDNVAVRRVVRIHALAEGMAVVKSGLRPGDRLIVLGNRLVSDGSPVKPVGVEPAEGE